MRKKLIKQSIWLMLMAMILAPGIIAMAEMPLGENTPQPESITLKLLEPWGFPGEGFILGDAEIKVLAQPRGETIGTLSPGSEIKVTDYVQGYYEIETEAGPGYVAEGEMLVLFAKAVTGEVLQEGFAVSESTGAAQGQENTPYTQNTEDVINTTDTVNTLKIEDIKDIEDIEDMEAMPRVNILVKGLYVHVIGREGDQWLLQMQDGNISYTEAGNIAIWPRIAMWFDGGSHGSDEVTTIQGSAVVSGNAILKNIVIEGNLYILGSVTELELSDTYVLHSTMPQGSIRIAQTGSKLKNAIGDPKEAIKDMVWSGSDEEYAEKAQGLLEKIRDGVYGGEGVDEQ